MVGKKLIDVLGLCMEDIAYMNSLTHEPKEFEDPPKDFAPKKKIYHSGMKDINQPADILKKLCEYSLNPSGFLLLSGLNGTGKSFAARAILNEQAGKSYFHDSDHRLMITQAELHTKWKSHIYQYKEDEYFIKKINAVRFLVIDDLGDYIPTDAFKAFLSNIIHFREEEWMATVITTNLTGDQATEQLGGAICSRISSGIRIRLEGKDRRINTW